MYMILLLMIYIFYSHYIFYKVCVLYYNDLDNEKKKHIETNHILDLFINILRYTIEERKKCEICRKDYCC